MGIYGFRFSNVRNPNIDLFAIIGEGRYSDDHFDPALFSRLAVAFAKNFSLKYLTITNSFLHAAHAVHLANITLKDNPTLKYLILPNNSLGDNGLEIMLNALNEGHVEHFDCSHNNITIEGAKKLAAFLESNQSLKHLKISGNSWGEDGIEAIFAGLPHNKTLQLLDISNDEVGEKSALGIVSALKNSNLKSLALEGCKISPAGLAIIASGLTDIPSLEYLNLSKTQIGIEGAKVLAAGLAGHHRLKVINLSDSDISLAGFNAIATSANPSLVEIFYELPNSDSYRKLFEKMKKPESLTKADYIQIKDNILAIVHTQLYPSRYDRDTPEKKARRLTELASIIEPVRLKAQEAGIQIESYYLLTDYLKRQEEALKAAEAKYLAQIAAPTKNELKKYAERNGLTLEDFANAVASGTTISAIAAPIAGFLGGRPTLAHLEALLEWNKNSPIADDPAHRTAKQFIAHSVIAHLDYFVMFAMKKEELSGIKPDEYPLIQAYSSGAYRLDEEPHDRLEFSNAKVAKLAQAEVRPLDLASLRDGVVAPHMDKMRDALAEVNDRLADFELAHIEKLTEIATILNNILAKEGKKSKVVQERDEVTRDNRKLEREIRAAKRVLEARKEEDKKRLALSDGDKVLYVAYEALKSIPWVGNGMRAALDVQHVVDVASEGAEDFGLVKAKDIRIRQSISRQAQRAQQDMIDKIILMVGDVRKYDREIKQIEKLIGELTEAKDEKEQLTTATTREAVRELFLSRYILEHGMQNSRDLEEVCEGNPKVGNIDNLLDMFDRKSRIGEALQNLCFGYADSNDLCVIMAEVNGFKQPLAPEQQVLHDFSDDLLKPNLGDFFSHASKMDFVYQVGLAGLGTNLHNGRKMVREAHDQRMATLFADAFGVKTTANDLTVAGALDVQKLFGYYMERHGKNTMSAERLHDGEVTDARQRKAVNVLPYDTESDFVENVKRSQALRRNSQPDVGDLFLRICGYEYFVPQAVNAAGKDNLMRENPEAPAAYPMANRVITQFINNMGMGSIGGYREKVRTRVDNLIAQTFMDFFSELGSVHSQNPRLVEKRINLKNAFYKSENYGRTFDTYCNNITRDALSQYPLFLEIYARNLEKQLAGLPKSEAAELREQIAYVKKTCEALAPDVIEPGSAQAKLAANELNHSFENTHWRGGIQ